MKTVLRNAVLAVISLSLILSAAPAMASTETEQEYRFSREELTQMLSPIALYPDSLLAQILMASTYPLEIVEAERWLRKNNKLQGDALYDALKDKEWDTSVKSLCNFPDVIFALSDKIEQTRSLGDAFLSQEDDIMDVVQELRNNAYDRGNLKTTKEQKVIVESKIIRIEPAVSGIIYVPAYDPLYVYGTWRYPAYPPYYWCSPPRSFFRISYIRFNPPVSVSIGLFSWAWFDWSSLHIYIVIDDACRYHRHYVHRDMDFPYWRHDPHHRRGVDYRDRDTNDRFVQRPPRPREDWRETRIPQPEPPRYDRDESGRRDGLPPAAPDDRYGRQPAEPGDRYSDVTGDRPEPSRTPAGRDRDTDFTRTKPERIQIPAPESRSQEKNTDGSFQRKATEREDRNSGGATKLSLHNPPERTTNTWEYNKHTQDKQRTAEKSGRDERNSGHATD